MVEFFYSFQIFVTSNGLKKNGTKRVLPRHIAKAERPRCPARSLCMSDGSPRWGEPSVDEAETFSYRENRTVAANTFVEGSQARRNLKFHFARPMIES